MIALIGTLATAARAHSNYRFAAQLLHEYIGLRWELGFDEGIVRFMIGIAGIALFADRSEQAAYFLGVTERMPSWVDHYGPLTNREECARVERDIHSRFGEAEFGAIPETRHCTKG